MAIRAGKTHFVDISQPTVLPWDEVVDLTSFWVGSASGAVPVASDGRLDLRWSREPPVAPDPKRLSLAVEDHGRDC